MRANKLDQGSTWYEDYHIQTFWQTGNHKEKSIHAPNATVSVISRLRDRRIGGLIFAAFTRLAQSGQTCTWRKRNQYQGDFSWFAAAQMRDWQPSTHTSLSASTRSFPIILSENLYPESSTSYSVLKAVIEEAPSSPGMSDVCPHGLTRAPLLHRVADQIHIFFNFVNAFLSSFSTIAGLLNDINTHRRFHHLSKSWQTGFHTSHLQKLHR